MKSIINSHNDIIISHEPYALEYEKSKPKWVDAENKTCRLKHRINKITIYAHTTINEYGQSQTSIVHLSESDITQLYNKMVSLKDTEYIGKFDYQDDDLPF